MEQNAISQLLRKIRSLQRFSFATQCAIALGAAYAGWMLSRVLTERYDLSSPTFVLIIIGALLLFVVSRSLAGFYSTGDISNAHQIDRIYDLKERITTYVELRKNNHPFLKPLIQETTPKLSGVSIWKASRFYSGLTLPVSLLLFLILALLVVPYLPVPQETIAKKEDRKGIVARAKELDETLRKLEKKQPEGDLKKLLQDFRKETQKLQQPDVDKSKALKQLNAMQDKLRKMDEKHRQQLTKDLQNAWDQAKQGEGKNDSLTDSQKAEVEKLAKSFDRAMEGKNPSGGTEKENLKSEQFSAKDLQSMKEALKKFQDQKAASEQMRSQLQEALENAQKGVTSSSKERKFVTDSTLKDREVETGKGGVEDGPGTTNKDSGPSHFDTKKKGTGEYVEDRTKSKYEQLYEGQREKVGKDPLYLQTHWNENGDPSYTNVRNFGINKDPSLTGNAEGLSNQSDQESVVRKERVPPSYQEIVKKYFENSDQPK
jgi:hypothetical protein